MIMESSEQHLCVYCGVAPSETADHVPPKLFLSLPYPENLLTVPSCWACNKSFQADDEYTRFIAAIDYRAGKNNTARLKLQAVVRAMQRPEATRFSAHLLRQMEHTIVLGSDGNPMASQVLVDQRRVDATGARLVRGLYYVEQKTILGSPQSLRVASKAGVSERDPAIQQFARMYSGCPDRRERQVGDAFDYVVCFWPTASIWLLMLYGYFSWLATIQTTVAQAA